MAKSKKYTVKLKRKLRKETNYSKRLKLIKSNKIRLVIRLHLTNIILQFIKYNPSGDQVIISINSKKLKEFGWKANRGNIPSAYLTGLYSGQIAKTKHIQEAVLDIGSYTSTKGSRIYAALKGVLDSGIKVPSSEEIFPSDQAISGDTISSYAKQISSNQVLYSKQFSNYIKNSLKPENLPDHFKETKNKIISGGTKVERKKEA